MIKKETIIIPSGVTEIKNKEFANYVNLGVIKLPDGLKRIGYGAFIHCSSLETIVIPESVTEIEDFAFSDCSNLREIHLSGHLKRIGRRAFYKCKSLETIVIPESVTEIEPCTFSDCSSLKKIYLSEHLNSIGESTFEKCKSLESIVIPESVTEIAECAFSDCSNLREIHLPGYLKRIGYGAFYGCSSLETIVIPKSVTEIAKYAFSSCSNLRNIHLSEHLNSIGHGAFYKCKSLESIVIPDSVTEIAEYAFSSCSNLREIHLSEHLNVIEYSVFQDCKSLESIVIPDSVTKIVKHAFADCSNLREIHLSEHLNVIEYSAFQDCNSLRTIVIPDSVTEIDEWAFSGFYTSCINSIIFNYKSYLNLKDFIRNNRNFFKNMLNHDLFPRLHISLVGPELSSSQRKKIQFFLRKKNFSFIVEQVLNDNSKNLDENIDTSNLDDDIQKIINEINELCSKLSNESREIINNKIVKLLDEYESNKKNLKPKYGDTQISLSLEIKDISMLKPKLFSNLEMIKLSLSKEDKLIQFLSELDIYKKMLSCDVNELSSESDSIEGMINNIIYYCKFVDSSKKQDYLNKLGNYIDIALKTTSNELVNVNNQEIVLNIKENLDTNMQLKLDISKLYDEVSNYSNKVRPFQELLNVFNAKEKVEKENFGDGIVGLINGIKYVIIRLSDSTYQDKLEDKFADIIGKYSFKIEKMLEKPDELNRFKYEELENDLRVELQPLLELMNNYAYLDSYEINTANNMNLLSQLYSCLDIIEGREIVDMKEEQKLESLTSTIIELDNYILSNDIIDDYEKNNIMLRLSEIINKYINELQDNTVKSLAEYNSKQREILGEFMCEKFNLDQFICETDIYNANVSNKHVK